jgi:hypothetical protein
VNAELLLGGLLVALALALVVYPLVTSRRTDGRTPSDADPSYGIEERRAAVRREMMELEQDFRAGKLDGEDYKQMSEACVVRAAALIAEADLHGSSDDELEREIARVRERIRSAGAAGWERGVGEIE